MRTAANSAFQHVELSLVSIFCSGYGTGLDSGLAICKFGCMEERQVERDEAYGATASFHAFDDCFILGRQTSRWVGDIVETHGWEKSFVFCYECDVAQARLLYLRHRYRIDIPLADEKCQNFLARAFWWQPHQN